MSGVAEVQNKKPRWGQQGWGQMCSNQGLVSHYVIIQNKQGMPNEHSSHATTRRLAKQENVLPAMFKASHAGKKVHDCKEVHRAP